MIEAIGFLHSKEELLKIMLSLLLSEEVLATLSYKDTIRYL